MSSHRVKAVSPEDNVKFRTSKPKKKTVGELNLYLCLHTIVQKVDQTARKRSDIRTGSQVRSNYTRQLIISQLASIMARDPGLLLKNQKTESSRFNDPRISAGFTGSGFLPRPLDKSLLPASRGGTEFVKLGNNAGK